jgi:hypothetical protein
MVAILSVDNYDHIAVILNAATNTIWVEVKQRRLVHVQEFLLQVAQYMEPADLVQWLCDHPAQIIML